MLPTLTKALVGLEPMTWNCRCELCRRAFQQQLDESHEWMNFLLHREHVVLELVRDREPTVYLAEIDGDVLVTTEKTDGYKTLEETWHEEVRLNQYIAGCRVVIHEDGGTPFDDVLREKVVA